MTTVERDPADPPIWQDIEADGDVMSFEQLGDYVGWAYEDDPEYPPKGACESYVEIYVEVGESLFPVTEATVEKGNRRIILRTGPHRLGGPRHLDAHLVTATYPDLLPIVEDLTALLYKRTALGEDYTEEQARQWDISVAYRRKEQAVRFLTSACDALTAERDRLAQTGKGV